MMVVVESRGLLYQELRRQVWSAKQSKEAAAPRKTSGGAPTQIS
jgi:hypothetical protein